MISTAHHHIVRLLTLLLFLAANGLYSQEVTDGGIFFDALPFASVGAEPSAARLDILVAVPYESLEFEREGKRFRGRYQLVITLSGDRETIDTTFARDLLLESLQFGKGSVGTTDFYQLRFPVAPGVWKADLTLLGLNTQRTRVLSRTVPVPDFSAERFALSGMMLLAKIRLDQDRLIATPLLVENASLLRDHFLVMFEAYNDLGLDSIHLETRIHREDSSVAATHNFTRSLDAGRNQVWLRIPIEGLSRGRYVVEVDALTDTSDGSVVLARTGRRIRLEGTASGMPLSEMELADRITKLRYVASQREMDYIRDGDTFEQRLARYEEFWRLYDPSPGTPTNEAMQEYFSRIEYANQTFRGRPEGWLSDMGRVYIVLGPPDRVERDAFRTDGRQREVWEYYGERLRLVFEDETGFGDYRLLNPIPLNRKYRY